MQSATAHYREYVAYFLNIDAPGAVHGVWQMLTHEIFCMLPPCLIMGFAFA
jgi:hypothetical protein